MFKNHLFYKLPLYSFAVPGYYKDKSDHDHDHENNHHNDETNHPPCSSARCPERSLSGRPWLRFSKSFKLDRSEIKMTVLDKFLKTSKLNKFKKTKYKFETSIFLPGNIAFLK